MVFQFRSLWLNSSLLVVAAGVGLGFAAAAAPAIAESSDPHAHHHMAAADADVRRSEVNYATPNVKLVRDDGKTVAFPAELDDGRPVVMNFIYTSCTTICPMSSQIFQQFQDDLGSRRNAVHLISISIDPEQDTPARLRAYAAKFNADSNWNHYSGTLGASITVQQAFNAYRGDKMNHSPLTLMRAAPGKPWVRLDGFARADDLLAEQKSWDLSAPSLVAR